MQKVIAEAFGTFMLTLVVGLSLYGVFPIATPVLAAVTLGLFVYSIGTLSGAHINPAVTIGAWSIKKITPQDALQYIVAQFVGAFIALRLVSYTTGMVASMPVVATPALYAETVGMIFFSFGIASVIFGKTPSYLSGIVVGGSLFIGIAVAALMGSNGVLNPAVALGIGSFNLAYLGGPILGSIIGMQFYAWLRSRG